MRRILAGLACAFVISAQAQVITGAMLMPNPLGVILSIGQWIIFEGEKTYYIEVLGEGRTPDEARANGFRLAVEQAVGTVVASETEVNNARITRDEIITYASGYVTKYEIVKQEAGGIGVKTNMRVWIKRSNIARRLLNESRRAGEVDGAVAAVSLTTIIDERVTGDQLIKAVLNDYPRRAFDIEIGKSQVTFDNNRQSTLVVPYILKFNQNYIQALYSALKATENPKSCAAGVRVNASGWFNGGTIAFDDSNKYNLLASRFVYNPAQLQMTLYAEDGTRLYQDIFKVRDTSPSSDNMYKPGLFELAWRGSCAPYGITVNGDRAVGGNLLIENINPEFLRRISRVEIRAI
jgi:hypothetical protein